MRVIPVVCYQLFAVLVAVTVTTVSSLYAAESQGGFIESSTSTDVRAVLSKDQILDFLPGRGEFTFPAPYDTKAVRLTNGNDCNGQDCVNYAGYAYWRNINNHAGRESLLVFVGLDRNQGGPGPSLFEYNKITGVVTQLGTLFDDNHPLAWSTGEGWYFSATLPTKLYVNDGFLIQRLDVISGELETVMDVREVAGPDYYISQLHSSDDDRVHSATMRDADSYQTLGCMTYNEPDASFQFFPSQGNFDECQVDRSGKWLVIKEDVDGINGEDNRIINLDTLQERHILDSEGAAGHSDLGHGYMIAADNWGSQANTWKVWNFLDSDLSGKTVYHNLDWNVFAPAHVSHTNARDDLAPEQQFACGSSVNSNNSTHANEIICFALDSSMDTLVVAPGMTDLDAAGGGGEYAKLPKGNLDITGQYFFWTSNASGDRQDAFLVKVPDYLTTGEAAPAPSGVGTTTAPPPTEEESGDDPTGTPTNTGGETTVDDPDPVLSAGAVRWVNRLNVTVVDGGLSKTAGCDGCADAHATSEQQITQGDGSLQFTVTDSDDLVYVGLKLQGSPDSPSAIDLAIRLQSGYAEVREKDFYRADTPYSPGDSFRIAIVANTVQYAKNGSVFYTSDAVHQYPLQAQAILLSLDSSVNDATLDVPIEAAIDASIDEPVDTAIEEPIETSIDTPIETSIDEPIETSIDEPVDTSIDEPIETSIDEPIDGSADDGTTGSSAPNDASTPQNTVSTFQALQVSATTELPADAVVWTNKVNVATNGRRLSRKAGCDGCPDAGASSVQQIRQGDGALQFTVTDANDLVYAGLKQRNSQTGADAIDFAIRLQTGFAEVRESGIYRADIAFATGDEFRIAIVGSTVQYSKNGSVFYTSDAEPQYPLNVKTILFSENSAIEDTTITAESGPRISGLQAGVISADSVMLRWTTDVEAENIVQYGTISRYGSLSPYMTELTKQHSVTLTGLNAGTAYHYRVANRSADGHITVSSDHVFIMPAL